MNKLLQSNFTNLDFEIGTLTKLVHRSHKICFLGYAYHPYHIAMDVGTLTLLAFSYWWVYRQPQISFLAFFGAFLSMQAAYFTIRFLKQRIWGVTERSFIQDSILILLPTYKLVSLVFGNAMPTQGM